MGRHLLNSFAAEDPERFASSLNSSGDLKQILTILEEIDDGLESRVISRLPTDLVDRLLNEVPDSLVTKWLDAGEVDAGHRLLSKIRRDRAARLIEGVHDRSKRRALRRLTGYASGTVGQLAQAVLFSITEDTKVSDFEAQLQRFEGKLDGPVIVERQDGTVAGILDFVKLAQHTGKGATVADFCLRVRPLLADAALPSLSSLSRSGEWAKLTSMPVVDHRRRLIGYVTRSSLENATISEKESSLFLDSMIELVKQYWNFLGNVLVIILGRRTSS